MAARDIDYLWWFSVPYLYALGLIGILTPYAHALSTFFLFGYILWLFAALWLLRIGSRIANHSLGLDNRTKAMMAASLLILPVWLFWAFTGS